MYLLIYIKKDVNPAEVSQKAGTDITTRNIKRNIIVDLTAVRAIHTQEDVSLLLFSLKKEKIKESQEALQEQEESQI